MRGLTNIKPPPHTPRQIGSGKRRRGPSLRHGPAGTTPSRRSSPPSFPSPSTPTRSARIYGDSRETVGSGASRRGNSSRTSLPVITRLIKDVLDKNEALTECQLLNWIQILAKWEEIKCSNFTIFLRCVTPTCKRLRKRNKWKYSADIWPKSII